MQALASFWGMIAGANPNAIIAVFTVVIAGTTIAYTLVTWRLLRQARWAFLVDTLIRIMGRTEEPTRRYLNEAIDKISQRVRKVGNELKKEELGKDIKEQWKDIEMRCNHAGLRLGTEPYFTSMCEAIGTINEKFARDFRKSLRSYGEKTIEGMDEVVNEINTLKDRLDRLIKEVEKQAKSEET